MRGGRLVHFSTCDYQSSGYRPKMGLRSKWSISEVLLHIVITHEWRHLTDSIKLPKGDKVNIAQEQPPMGPNHEKKIYRLIYPTLTFSTLTTRLYIHVQSVKAPSMGQSSWMLINQGLLFFIIGMVQNSVWISQSF